MQYFCFAYLTFAFANFLWEISVTVLRKMPASCDRASGLIPSVGESLPIFARAVLLYCHWDL